MHAGTNLPNDLQLGQARVTLWKGSGEDLEGSFERYGPSMSNEPWQIWRVQVSARGFYLWQGGKPYRKTTFDAPAQAIASGYEDFFHLFEAATYAHANLELLEVRGFQTLAEIKTTNERTYCQASYDRLRYRRETYHPRILPAMPYAHQRKILEQPHPKIPTIREPQLEDLAARQENVKQDEKAQRLREFRVKQYGRRKGERQ